MTGDFNQVMDGVLDKSQYKGPPIPRDRAALHMLTEDIGLTDIWRLVNPTQREYTFFSQSFFKSSIKNYIHLQVVWMKQN